MAGNLVALVARAAHESCLPAFVTVSTTSLPASFGFFMPANFETSNLKHSSPLFYGLSGTVDDLFNRL
jgi:hypothetical protein